MTQNHLGARPTRAGSPPRRSPCSRSPPPPRPPGRSWTPRSPFADPPGPAVHAAAGESFDWGAAGVGAAATAALVLVATGGFRARPIAAAREVVS